MEKSALGVVMITKKGALPSIFFISGHGIHGFQVANIANYIEWNHSFKATHYAELVRHHLHAGHIAEALWYI